ncbi:MAG: hypothetical protein WAO08_09870, partial [Hyphomicrobiaceae bacterium]
TSYASCAGITANPDARCAPSQPSSAALNSKAALLGLSWPLEFRASAKGTSKLSEYQQAEALRHLAAGESCGAIARTVSGHPSTISR